MNLPSSWQLIKTIISNQSATQKTLDYIINTLTNYEIQLQKQKELKPQTTALASITDSNSHNVTKNGPSNWTRGCRITWSHGQGCGRGRGYGRGYGRGGRDGRHSGRDDRHSGQIGRTNKDPSITCWYCLRPGHKEEECRTKRRAEEAKMQQLERRNMKAGFTRAESFMARSTPIHYSDQRNWYIDSGATNHLCSDQSQFSNLRMLPSPISVYMGDGKPIQATATGTIQLRTGLLHPLQLTNALLVPNIKHNLMAVNRLDKHYKLVFTNGKCYISDKHGRTIAEAQSENNLY